ncbi:MAG TPA: RsmD family RNA methyltransferase, partial [Myxococcota bacterium]|nr:RsmD family RNA methyltransferase [Myxococcota bacterium]
RVAAALRQSALALGASGVEVVESDALSYLRRAGERFDVAFVDPPFASRLAAAALEALPPRLAPGARAYVEGAELPAASPPWKLLREDRAGAVRYALYSLAPDP